MRDYVRGKGWVGAKDGKPVDPTTGQPKEDAAPKAGAPITKERDYAIWVANNILDDPLRDPDSDTSVLARHFIRSLEPAAGSAALLDAPLAAADAGPRQPDKCGEPASSFIPRWGMSFACVLPKGHEGEHKQGGNCFKHGEYIGAKCPQWPDCPAPPVPQEAAPPPEIGSNSVTYSENSSPYGETHICPTCNGYHAGGCHRAKATAPDSAMRVGLAERKIRQRFSQHGDLARIDDILAALIREAGSREPDGWAHQYHNCIRFNQGQTVNGEQPFHAVPYWLETNGEAGSERERELRETVEELQLLRKRFRERHTLNEAEAARCDVLIDLLASRLLGGE